MFDEHFISQEQEHYDFHYPSLSEINREMARHIGEANQDKQWVLTDFDVWERNPFYNGPEQPHPEDESFYYEESDKIPATLTNVNLEELELSDDEIPF